ncbi:MAG: HDIG domain-containing protein [Anaerolineales bacterium]|nr:HDIG domain-containing protein [Anaerolineales bacterium]
MSEQRNQSESWTEAWRNWILVALLVAAALIVFLALYLPDIINQAPVSLSEGDVAPVDIVAPVAITYESEVLTQDRQEAAAALVPAVYTFPDPSVAREEVETLNSTLNYITVVREDEFATFDQKLTDLAALRDIQLTQETAARILDLSPTRWAVLTAEAVDVLEQVMRNTIRENRLEEARQGVLPLVSLSIPLDQAEIVAEIVAAFIVPNSFVDDQLTEAARERAREGAQPVVRSFVAGELIVDSGRVVTAADLEALERFGLQEPEYRWQDLAGVIGLVAIVMLYLVLYLRFDPFLTREIKSLVVFGMLALIFLIGARLSIPGRTVIPFLYPLAAFSLIIAALYGTRYGIAFAVPLSILVAYDLPDPLALTMYFLLTCIIGTLALGSAQRISGFIWAGVAIAFAASMAVLAYVVPNPTVDLVGVATLLGSGILNGIASASIAFLVTFIIASILGLVTPLRLLELSRPDNPLLQYLLRTAPGTYQHSLQVANLAEQAAEGIGADALLTRVGALYHDVGKTTNPYFFIENQPPGFENPHEGLEPEESAAIIIQHVPDGLVLAEKHRLPDRIKDFIREHHGTMVTRYQYISAVNRADGDKSVVDMNLFQYPGPKPQSRETALVMLADGCEARARSEIPQSTEQVAELVNNVIEHRRANGQLDDTDLTTRDLKIVTELFIATMRGFYHPRIVYPKFDAPTLPASTVLAQLEPGDSQQAPAVEVIEPDGPSAKLAPGPASENSKDTGSDAAGDGAAEPDTLTSPDPSTPTA